MAPLTSRSRLPPRTRPANLALPTAPNILECAHASRNRRPRWQGPRGWSMPDISRRDFARLAGSCGAGGLVVSPWPRFALAQASAKVVIVGGGAGGATVAHFLKKGAPEL